MIRLLMVDDHPVVRTGYQMLLEQGQRFRVVAQAASSQEALAACATHEPDMVITDLSIPGCGGLELVRRIAAHPARRARVLVLSMHDSHMLVRRALEFGASAFVTKASRPQCLLDAVDAVMSGRTYLSQDLPRRLLDPRAAPVDSRCLDELSQREFEIFRLLARGASSAECAAALHLSPKTIANHQSTIKEKLGVATSAAMAHLALRHGLIEVR